MKLSGVTSDDRDRLADELAGAERDQHVQDEQVRSE